MESKTQSSLFEKILFHPITKIVLGTIAIVLVIGLVKTFITKPLFLAIIPAEEIAIFITASFSTLLMIVVYYFLLKYYEKRPFTEFAPEFIGKELFGGFLLGFGVIGLEVLILYFLGFYEVVSINSFYAFIPSIALIMGGVMLEELVFRGLVYRILEDWKGSGIALIVSSIIFQLPHFTNPNEALLPAILGILFGLATAVMYAYTRRLWLPFAFHFGWNIAQPALGTTLSGIDEFDLLVDAKMNGPELLTGSAFGIEDSLMSMLVLIILFWIFYRKIIKAGLWVDRK